MSDRAVLKWSILFRERGIAVHYEWLEKQVRSNKRHCRKSKRNNSRASSVYICWTVDFSKISWSTLYDIITVKLGYHKFCARWVPKHFTNIPKNQRVSLSLTFLRSCSREKAFLGNQKLVGIWTWINKNHLIHPITFC